MTLPYENKDSIAILNDEDDAAKSTWGDSVRIPTLEDFKELSSKCMWTWVDSTSYKTCGYHIVGPNGQSIFLPAAGYCQSDSIYRQETFGCYWTSSLYSGTYKSYNSYGFSFSQKGKNCYDDKRFYGQSIRPVANR